MRVPKTVIRTGISIVALLVLFVGGGIAYVWYSGQNTDASITATPAPADTKPAAVITPSKPSLKSPVSASVQYITSPVVPGSNASASIKTTPTANCTVSVTYDNVASKDSGLSPKNADDYGIVSWTWSVEESAPYGKWPVKVNCKYGEKSAVVQADLVIAKTAE